MSICPRTGVSRPECSCPGCLAEQIRTWGDFDVIAFSVSFEWDYTNVVTMLRLAGLPVRAAQRTARDPLVVVGGAVTFVNPEPLAPFADVIAAGEGEVLIPDLVDVLTTGRWPDRCDEDLRRHVKVCEGCQDVLAVLEPIGDAWMQTRAAG